MNQCKDGREGVKKMDREKQIEEMAKIIARRSMAFRNPNIAFMTTARKTAVSIYNAGYLKQSEGEWMAKEKIIRSITALNYTCSVCGVKGRCTPYCPNCGAKMKGGA